MRVCVVGCGNISKCHFSALQELPDITISSAVDVVPEKADAAAEKYGCKAYYDFMTMLDEDRPDAVHLCTPHYLHADMAVEALSRGIHVLCEKPCAISAGDLQKLRLAQLMSTAEFGVCFQNRYNNSVREIKALLDSGKYGEIKAVSASVCWYRNEEYYSDDWHGRLATEGGGVLVNQAIHTLDLLRWLTGRNIVSVTAHTFNDSLKDVIEVEDTACARFEFEGGALGIFNATVAFGVNAPVRIDFYCQEAVLRLEGDNAYVIKDGNVGQLHLSESEDFVGKSYWGKGHASLITDFYRCIEENRRFSIDANEGGKAVEEFLAMYSSSRSGDKVLLKKD